LLRPCIRPHREANPRYNRIRLRGDYMAGSHLYVWQKPSWPSWRWHDAELIGPLARCRLAQGRLLGKAAALGFEPGLDLRAEVLTEETIETAAIEGESLNLDAVRSSVARNLGLPTAGLVPSERRAE